MDYLPKDPAILVSSVNMLLRDEEFDTLESLCYAFSREPQEIKDYLKAYIPDGIREFQDYPSASLGWMMYIGMAVAMMWDTEWDIYSKIDDLYTYMRDKRGYDAMDEYIREEVLLLQGVDYTALEKLTGECASRVYNALMHQRIEPGTKEAFEAYVSCLHQLYLFGAAMQLKRMGYHMTKMQ